MVFCGESIITEISVYVSFYMSEFIIQSTFHFLMPAAVPLPFQGPYNVVK